jgi:hypothetical protein
VNPPKKGSFGFPVQDRTIGQNKFEFIPDEYCRCVGGGGDAGISQAEGQPAHVYHKLQLNNTCNQGCTIAATATSIQGKQG